MNEPSQRGRWVAIITGAISIAIAVAYLALITVLDARGPLQPPPPEASAWPLRLSAPWPRRQLPCVARRCSGSTTRLKAASRKAAQR